MNSMIKMLVVDDEPDVEALFTQLVLVLSDINMPGMTGLELLGIIRKEFPTLKVMMVTAYGDQSNYDKARELGANDFVTKPVDFADLKARILAMA